MMGIRGRTGWIILVFIAVSIAGWGLYRWTFNSTTSSPPKNQSNRATIKARVIQVPPKGYDSPNPNASLDNTEDSAAAVQKTIRLLREETQHARRTDVEPAGLGSAIVPKIVEKKLDDLGTDLNQKQKNTLLNWVLTKEGLRDGDVSNRNQLVDRLKDSILKKPTKKSRVVRAPDTPCRKSLEFPDNLKMESPGRPRFGHVDITKQSNGSGWFHMNYAFRQKFPGPYPSDTWKESAGDPDYYPRHPLIDTVESHPDTAFFVLTETSVFRANRLQATDPAQRYPDANYTRTVGGTIPAEKYDGARSGLGYLGRAEPTPRIPDTAPLELTRKSCLVRKLRSQFAERKRAVSVGRLWSVGENNTTHRMLIEFKAVNGNRYTQNRWILVGDLTDRTLSIRAVLGTYADPDIIADRNHDGLADLLYFPGTLNGPVILLNGTIKIQTVQISIA